MRLRILPFEAEAIYGDYSHTFVCGLGSVLIQRASHIEPVIAPRWFEWLLPTNWFGAGRRVLKGRFVFSPTKGFGIFWCGRFKKLWAADFVNDYDIPFLSYEAAKHYEVTKLNSQLFGSTVKES